MIVEMQDRGDLADQVQDALRDVSRTAIEPRFATLLAEEIVEKSPGEVVTIADREAEVLLEGRLGAILPGIPFVGEEACSRDPTRLRGIHADYAWLVDPLDGTANFVEGSTDWAVMVALLMNGEPISSWIWQPMTGQMYVAGRGEGAYRNGQRLRSEPRAPSAVDLRGAVLSRFLDEPTAAAVARNQHRFGELSAGRRCAGTEYPALIEGDKDFVLFWRTLPWDHAPGALLVREAGGIASRPDGSPYQPSTEHIGLLAAADERTWSLAHGLLD